jgi:hypothetical protein
MLGSIGVVASRRWDYAGNGKQEEGGGAINVFWWCWCKNAKKECCMEEDLCPNHQKEVLPINGG